MYMYQLTHVCIDRLYEWLLNRTTSRVLKMHLKSFASILLLLGESVKDLSKPTGVSSRHDLLTSIMNNAFRHAATQL